MYNKGLLIDRIEARLQKHVGRSYQFKSDRERKLNTLHVQRNLKNFGYYPILEFIPHKDKSKIAQSIQPVGYINISEISGIAKVCVEVDNPIDPEVTFSYYRPFLTSVLIERQNILSREDMALYFEDYDEDLSIPKGILTPQQILPNELFIIHPYQ